MYGATVLKGKMISSSYNFAAKKSFNKIRLFFSFMVYLGTLFAYKEHRTRNIPRRGGRACMAGCRGCWLLGTLALVLNTDCKYQPSRVACTEGVHCANALRVIVAAQSFATKSFLCSSIAFLAGIIS